jgi:cell division protein FtsB
MKWENIVIVAILGVMVIVAVYQTYMFRRAGTEATREMEALHRQLEDMRRDRAMLHEELKYFKRPENLEKELRARFNYREPDEKTIIVVPKSNTSSAN